MLGIAFAFAGAAFMVFYGQVPHRLCEALGVFGTGLFEKIGVFPFHLPKKWRPHLQPRCMSVGPSVGPAAAHAALLAHLAGRLGWCFSHLCPTLREWGDRPSNTRRAETAATGAAAAAAGAALAAKWSAPLRQRSRVPHGVPQSPPAPSVAVGHLSV